MLIVVYDVNVLLIGTALPYTKRFFMKFGIVTFTKICRIAPDLVKKSQNYQANYMKTKYVSYCWQRDMYNRVTGNSLLFFRGSACGTCYIVISGICTSTMQEDRNVAFLWQL